MRSKLREDGIPTRSDISLMSEAEKAIREASLKVEELGAHLDLTEAVNLLQQAQDKVADFIERNQ